MHQGLIKSQVLGRINFSRVSRIGCEIGKYTAQPFTTKVSMSTALFDPVHSYIRGHAPTSSYSGNRYSVSLMVTLEFTRSTCLNNHWKFRLLIMLSHQWSTLGAIEGWTSKDRYAKTTLPSTVPNSVTIVCSMLFRMRLWLIFWEQPPSSLDGHNSSAVLRSKPMYPFAHTVSTSLSLAWLRA